MAISSGVSSTSSHETSTGADGVLRSITRTPGAKVPTYARVPATVTETDAPAVR